MLLSALLRTSTTLRLALFAGSILCIGSALAGNDTQIKPDPAASVAAAPQPLAGKPVTAPERAAGMTIYLDPQTGRFLKEPAPGTEVLVLTPQLQNALSTSHEGLVETPSEAPGGGVKLDLQGRFQNPLVVTIDADGKVKMQHLDETSKSGDKK